ncbi:MAG: MraY family glycosyltransferase [Patescibacteria group bacterium]|nr:MraY family glycosyltransferase [Patescibacteria group bacterium]
MKNIAIKLNIVDIANSERKIHKGSVPLLGGVAIFLSFFVVAFIFRDKLLSGDLEFSHWLGVFLGGVVLMIGGFLDDKYSLSPKKQFIFPAIAILLVIFGGVGIEKITNPFGGYLYFDSLKIFLFNLWGQNLYFTVLSDVFIFLWLLGMMYTTKLLDGMDGLVTGITAIGAFIIFIFTLTSKYYQPDIAVASLTLFAACLGFLIFNWHPAKIFLGEGGSLLLGFLLGILAIISGGKIAIALLVMGVPILDVVWTIIRRIASGKNPFRFADRKHLHFRLYDLGIGQRKTVLIFYSLSLLFGMSAVFLQSVGKIYALGLLILLMLSLVFTFRIIENKK